jgi:ATP-dependent Clp protease ATP-binding subunit ClpA
MGWFESAKKLLKQSEAKDIAEGSMSNFTPRAQQVFVLAQREAKRLHHNFIGTEHVLLGLIALGQGVALNVLEALGLNLENVRSEVEKQAGRGSEAVYAGKIPFTPSVKKVLAYAREEATALYHTYVGTEHLLLGLLRDREGIAAQVLKNFNIDLELIRMSILKELDPNLIPENLLQASVKPNSFSVKIRDWSPRDVEGFTPRSIQAIAFSREEAERLHQNAIGTDHLLLGIIRLEKGVAVNVLNNLGFSLDIIRAEAAARSIPHEKLFGTIPYTPRTNHVLKMAKEEAKALNHSYIGVEHLLLGLLREGEGPAAEIFKHLEIDVKVARKKILDELNSAPPE